ncbi:UDP-N-acetylglucosamine--N-acetylmuramyl-(pentapeptide) pyrophosphoryl-undecaprenol N-acetylglucosamine transferase [hydrothermal vent metagenome]|uniref:UDP-N-acetylglucosamine--N-acetylmuramyl-(Pentapeptide) pyrophosphoryl-undecaprenol N-acetylglucosamine transferase n=1 Tax=hydrothermal vent metagenome TaxID=652676 RepID=A0A3B0SVM2_9ZZZZ
MTDTNKGLIVLAAGGTGGHLFPAQALGEELVRRGYVVHLMSDERVRDYGSKFPAADTHVIQSSTILIRKPWTWPGSLMRLWSGYKKARAVFDTVKPLAVIGFGGYPSLPPLIAAWRAEIPSLVHEQNAVMGRANRLVARKVNKIASSFPKIVNLDASLNDKVVMTGNPVRDLVLKSTGGEYEAPSPRGTFRILVFGGSQGAQFFSQMMPKVFGELSGVITKKLSIVQQCRPEDIDGVRAQYEKLGLKFELQAFFSDMPKRIANAHLVIGRSGASTIAELGVIGRPAILVPLPHALDNDQLRNAESFAGAGAGWVMMQDDIEASALAAFLTRLRYQEDELNNAARAALLQGHPDAAQKLADLVEATIHSQNRKTA